MPECDAGITVIQKNAVVLRKKHVEIFRADISGSKLWPKAQASVEKMSTAESAGLGGGCVSVHCTMLSPSLQLWNFSRYKYSTTLEERNSAGNFSGRVWLFRPTVGMVWWLHSLYLSVRLLQLVQLPRSLPGEGGEVTLCLLPPCGCWGPSESCTHPQPQDYRRQVNPLPSSVLTFGLRHHPTSCSYQQVAEGHIDVSQLFLSPRGPVCDHLGLT